MLFQLYFFGPVNIYEWGYGIISQSYIALHREKFLDIPASGRLFVEQANKEKNGDIAFFIIKNYDMAHFCADFREAGTEEMVRTGRHKRFHRNYKIGSKAHSDSYGLFFGY